VGCVVAPPPPLAFGHSIKAKIIKKSQLRNKLMRSRSQRNPTREKPKTPVENPRKAEDP
jgi:hypothetical protein